MSPEKTPFTASTPDKPAAAPRELIEMPDWGEPKPESEPLKEPLKTAEELVAEAEDLDEFGRLDLMTEYIKSIEARAINGGIKNKEGRLYGIDEIRGQLRQLARELNGRRVEDEDPMDSLTRADDLRPTFNKLLKAESTAAALMDALEARFLELDGKVVTIEAIGAKALDVVGVANPAERSVSPLAELTSGLGSDDISQLRSYSDALLAKKDAQRRGDGSGSTYMGQVAGEALRAMKPNVKLIANRYASMQSSS